MALTQYGSLKTGEVIDDEISLSGQRGGGVTFNL